MDLILDTCALLSLSGLAKKKLTSETLEAISACDTLYISACSLFEISLKFKRKQLKLGVFQSARAFWKESVDSYEIDSLAIEAIDFDEAVSLPDHHGDPFDRLIIAQALRTKSEIVTYDRLFECYDVAIVN